MNTVFYDQSHIKTVESGCYEIQKYLELGSASKILSILLCLDKYLDPYYGYHLTYTKEIYDLIESLLKSSKVVAVKEECLYLLQMYSDRDYDDCEILESGEIRHLKE